MHCLILIHLSLHSLISVTKCSEYCKKTHCTGLINRNWYAQSVPEWARSMRAKNEYTLTAVCLSWVYCRNANTLMKVSRLSRPKLKCGSPCDHLIRANARSPKISIVTWAELWCKDGVMTQSDSCSDDTRMTAWYSSLKVVLELVLWMSVGIQVSSDSIFYVGWVKPRRLLRIDIERSLPVPLSFCR